MQNNFIYQLLLHRPTAAGF